LLGAAGSGTPVHGAGFADEQVEECAVAWARALRTYREFAPGHPSRGPVCELLTQLLGACLARYGTLTLDVHADGFQRDGRVVEAPGRGDHTVPALLHAAGVRQVRFVPMPDRDEVDLLLAALVGGAAPRAGTDLASTLWACDLPHVSWLTAAPEELIPAVRPDRRAPPEWPACGLPAPVRSRASVPTTLEQTEDVDDWTIPYAAWTQPMMVPEGDPFDRVRLRLEIEDESRTGALERSLDFFAELIAAESDKPQLRQAVAAVGSVITGLLDDGALGAALTVLARAQEALHRHPLSRMLLPRERDELWAALLDAQAVGRGVHVWESAAQPELPELLAFIDEIEEASSDALCEVLLHSGLVKARRHACQRLIQVCATNPERLRPWLDRPEWFVTRNVAYVLANIPATAAEEMLLLLVQHGDARVRGECLAGLAGCRTAAARQATVALTDDPDLALRLSALRSLYATRDPVLADRLRARIQARTFSQLAQEERAALIETLGHVGSPDVVPLLESLLTQPSALDRRESDPMADAAARALAALEIPASYQVLRRAARSWSRPVRRAAETALAERPAPPGWEES
jgi:HEAT repeat protein